MLNHGRRPRFDKTSYHKISRNLEVTRSIFRVNNRSTIWHYCRRACQISERSKGYDIQSRALEILRDLTIVCWNGTLQFECGPVITQYVFFKLHQIHHKSHLTMRKRLSLVCSNCFISFTLISVQLLISSIIEWIMSAICSIIFILYNWYFVEKISYP